MLVSARARVVVLRPPASKLRQCSLSAVRRSSTLSTARPADAHHGDFADIANPTQRSLQPSRLRTPPFEHSGAYSKGLGVDEWTKLETWLVALDSILPVALRRSGATQTHPTNDASQELSKVVLEAREQAGIDLLSHLGLVEKRWPALLWITNALLQDPRPSTFFQDHAIRTSARWPSDQTLAEITATSRAPESLFTDYPAEATAIADPSLSLDELTATPPSAMQSQSHQQNKEVLGEIWRVLGTLILAAASDNNSESAEIMTMVLRITAQLHYQGYVPNKVCNEPSRGGRLALRQPPMLQALSADIMSSLIDTSVIADTVGDVTSLPRSPAFKPELWMEFTLWCCVHGGWLTEGAAIVDEMRQKSGQDRWNLVSWYTGSQPMARDWTPSKALDLFVLHEANQEVSPGASKIRRVISSEIVIALVDGLLTVANSPASPKEGPSRVLAQIQGLKTMLERNAMNLGTSTWDEVIARFAEIPNMNIEDHTKVMEDVLGLTQTFGREVNATNALDKPDRWAASSAYVFDGSASAVGLYHRLLAAYIKSRDTDSALRVLARLQHFTDANKTSALQSFLTRLTRNERVPQRNSAATSSGVDDASDRFQKLDYPSFFPNVPPAVLAALLNLVTESGEFDIGRWMVRSDDVDGPLIPADLYKHQALAPALIRFAAEAEEHALMRDLRKVQSPSMSGKTVVALAEGHLINADWQSGAKALATIQRYQLHEWNEPDLARIVSAHLSHVSFDRPSDNTQPALRSLYHTLEGRHGNLWTKLSYRDSVIGIVSTMHPKLAEFLASLLAIDHMSTLDISREAFEILLARAAHIFGSVTGQRLWELWCRSTTSSRHIKEPDRSKVVNVPVSQKAELFSAGHDQPGPSRSPPLAPSVTGFVQSNVSTLRIIVQQALLELQDSPQTRQTLNKSEEDPNEREPVLAAQARKVLSWAETLFAQEFDLRPADVDHELAGHATGLTAGGNSRPLYHQSTMKIWRAIHSSNPNWLMAIENKMRVFAMDQLTQQTIFDAVDSAGRRFLHCLASDFGLISESFGDEEERHVSVFKTPKTPTVPSVTADLQRLIGAMTIAAKNTSDYWKRELGRRRLRKL